MSDIDRRDRNAAFVEVMVLAAASDGSVSQGELEHLLGRVFERAEFDGTSSEELNRLVEESAKKLTGAKGLEAVLGSLAQRLPDHHSRLLAFALAASVAFSDQRATKAELGLLKSFQKALGIAEDEVVRVVDAVQRGRPLVEAVGEPIGRLYAEVMVLVSAADGRVQEGEARRIVEAFALDAAFEGITPEVAQQYVAEAVEALRTEGIPNRLEVLAKGIRTHEQRRRAYVLATQIAKSSDGVSNDEKRVLDLLQATFGIAEDEAKKLRRR